MEDLFRDLASASLGPRPLYRLGDGGDLAGLHLSLAQRQHLQKGKGLLGLIPGGHVLKDRLRLAVLGDDEGLTALGKAAGGPRIPPPCAPCARPDRVPPPGQDTHGQSSAARSDRPNSVRM